MPRVYHAKVRRVPDAETLERLRQGVRVEGERMAVDRVRVIEADNNAWLELTLHEGKHHEVRRLLEAVGHPVSKLRRVALGPVTTRGLEPGEFRAPLTRRRGCGAEVRRAARSAAWRAPPAPRPRPRPPRPGRAARPTPRAGRPRRCPTPVRAAAAPSARRPRSGRR